MDRPLSSDRSFGFVFALVFAFLGLLPFFRSKPAEVNLPLICAAALTLILAVFFPTTLRLPNEIWTRFGLVLQKLTNPIIMSVLFFAVLTPFSFLYRLFGNTFAKKPGQVQTYWIYRTVSKRTPQDMNRQF